MKSFIFVLKLWKRSSLHNLLSWRKAVIVAMAMTLFIAALWMVVPNEVSAVCGSTGIPSDTLTIKVGYYGGPYYTKKIYTITDFDQLPQVKQAYTYVDNLPAVCIDSAEGVKLSDLLEDAGIDINSVQKLYFYSTDIKEGWYQCLDKSYLFDTPRYYYPNLPSKWNYDTQSALPEATEDAVQVDAIMAYKDNWQRYADVPDFSNYDTSTRFRLLFGQVGTNEHNASMSAKWVHSIEVMLGGMPPSSIALDQSNINLKVGSTMQLTATVAPDDATEKSVNWGSSDPSVATVDKNGIVTVVGTGSAIISVSTVVGDITATCVLNDANQNSSTDIVATGNADEKTDDQHFVEVETSSAENYAQNTIDSKVSSGQEGGSQPWRIHEISFDAVPLQKQKESEIPVVCAAALLIFIFAAGAAKQYWNYLKDQ